MMQWEVNAEYVTDQGRACVVCHVQTREQAAPMGILSGRIACHAHHPDNEVIGAYLAWVTKIEQAKLL